MKIRGYDIIFKLIWYDAWIGCYYDRANKTIYLAPFPCCVFIIKKETEQ
jgi:hypothetical protein